MSVPTLTASPLSVCTDTRFDERWNDLGKRIEHDLRHLLRIVEDVRIVRDTILNSPTESSREHAQREYKESMDNIRTLAQEKFTYLFRQDMSEGKQASNVIDSDLLDVTRQQQRFLANICQDEERTPFISPGTFQNDEVILFTRPQQLADGERGSDKLSEGGYGSARAEDEPDESKDGAEVGEGEGDSNNPQQSPSSVPTQPLHSNSPVSQKESISYQGHPSTSKPVNDNDGEEMADARAYLAPSQPYSPRQSPSPGSQPQPLVWRSDHLASEPSAISWNFVRINGSIRSVLFPCSNSVSSTDSLSSSAGLNRTESQNPDQDRGNSIAHRDTERPLMQNPDLNVPNIALRERQNSTPASPHDGSSPSPAQQCYGQRSPMTFSPPQTTRGRVFRANTSIPMISGEPLWVLYALVPPLTTSTSTVAPPARVTRPCHMSPPLQQMAFVFSLTTSRARTVCGTDDAHAVCRALIPNKLPCRGRQRRSARKQMQPARKMRREESF